MQNSTVRVASRHMQRTASGTRNGGITELIDYLNFFSALMAFRNYTLDNPKSSPKIDTHLTKGLEYARRYLPVVREMFDQQVSPLAQDDARLAVALREANKGAGIEGIWNLAQAIKTFAQVLVAKTSLSARLADGDNLKRIRQVAQYASGTAEPAKLKAASGVIHKVNRKAKGWVNRAAKLADAAPSDDEQMVIAAAEARVVAQELVEVEAQIAAAEPDTEEAAALSVTRANLAAAITALAESTPDPAVVKAVAATQRTQQLSHATPIGKQLGMTAEQESALLADGKAIIAAGAGSGKTRVLSGKIVDLITREGVNSDRIIATSFSKKSAAELKSRVLKYGGESILDNGDSGFGTTHSVGYRLLRQFVPRFKRVRPMEPSYVSTLIKMAMKQVMLNPDYSASPNQLRAPKPISMFEGLYQSDTGPSQSDPDLDVGLEMMLDAIDFKGKWGLYGLAQWGATKKAVWARNALHMYDTMYHNRWGPKEMPQAMFDDFIRYLKTKGAKNRVMKHTGFTAQALIEAMKESRAGGMKRQGASGGKKSPYWQEPANQWFNLGVEKMVDDGGRAVGSKRFSTAISKYRANLVTPSQAWAKDRSVFAAVYGAYEWLKNNDPVNEGKIDFDDMLIEACRMLVANPSARAVCQAKYTHILVDEAQDLNRAQHVLFGLISGYYDAETQAPREDGQMTAKSFIFIGDDKQCLAEGTPVTLPDGSSRPIETFVSGDQVLAYRNGALMPQTVRHMRKSGWTWGYQVTTEAGRVLTMSPTHKLWATDPLLKKNQHLVYLMHRRDLGFRVGVTSNGRDDTHFGQRPVSEKAEKLWVLDVCPDKETALTLEQVYSLQYQIPTLEYHTQGRKMAHCHEPRIRKIFGMFGDNGWGLLEEKNFSFDLPHWMAQGYTIQMVAHGPKGTQVLAEVGPEIEIGNIPHKVRNSGVRVIREWFTNYREALTFAENLRDQTGLLMGQHLSSPAGSLRMLPASGLFPGMELVAREGDTLKMDTITSIKRVEGHKFFDIDVDDASNLFGSNLLISNSIYEFRGATPDLFIERSDAFQPEGAKLGGDFKTHLLEMNFRSGSSIVDAANKLIAHNTKQIPMVCQANADRKGEGLIHNVVVPSHAEGAAYAADQVAEMIEGEAYDATPADFGVAVRTNAEAYAYGVELLKRGIPFRSKMSFFNDYTTKALVMWLKLANTDYGDKQTINEIVLNAHRVPKFNLNREFEMQVQRLAQGENYLDWLSDGGWRKIYAGRQEWRNQKYVKTYTEALEYVQGLSGDPQDVLNAILKLKGSEIAGETMTIIDSLIEKVKGSPEHMDLLAEESESGDITDEAIRGLALAPIEPLMGLIGGYEDLGPALGFVERLQKANEKKHKRDNPDAEDYAEPAVVIDTCHGWKGLECKHMFVPMAAGVFPHRASMGDEEQMASERRLAYVALTRGENSVTVINPMRTHHGQAGGVSPFVSEACIQPLGSDAVTASRQASWTPLEEGWLDDVIADDMGYDDFEAWASTDTLETDWDADKAPSDPLASMWKETDYDMAPAVPGYDLED